MKVDVRLAPLPWIVDGLRGAEFSGTAIGRVGALLEAVCTDDDGFEAVLPVQVPPETIAAIATGADTKPRDTIRGLVDAATADVKARVLAERAAEEAAEAAARQEDAAAAALAKKVKDAIGLVALPMAEVVTDIGR